MPKLDSVYLDKIYCRTPRPEVATVHCGQRPYHLKGHREPTQTTFEMSQIGYSQPWLALAKGHNNWRVIGPGNFGTLHMSETCCITGLIYLHIKHWPYLTLRTLIYFIFITSTISTIIIESIYIVIGVYYIVFLIYYVQLTEHKFNTIAKTQMKVNWR